MPSHVEPSGQVVQLPDEKLWKPVAQASQFAPLVVVEPPAVTAVFPVHVHLPALPGVCSLFAGQDLHNTKPPLSESSA